MVRYFCFRQSCPFSFNSLCPTLASAPQALIFPLKKWGEDGNRPKKIGEKDGNRSKKFGDSNGSAG